MIVAVGGAGGFIGTALAQALRGAGHRVRPLLRPSSPPVADGIRWDPAGGTIQSEELAGVDAFVNLAGESIGTARWTKRRKREMRDSRVQSTALLARTVAGMTPRPKVLVCASASGYYGERGEEILDESAPQGEGFLAGLVADWEAAATPAAAAGIRTVWLRSGIVLGPQGGLLARLLPVFRMGAGGRLGRGRQWMSWISIEDEVRAIAHVLERDDCAGPHNLCSPNPVVNADFSAILARVLRRPSFLPVPAFALTLLFGAEPTREAFLASQRMTPVALDGSGFAFRHPGIEPALRALLDRPG
ncbi:MAG: TIGR01777 family oxidoreductase [Actinomycetota bacterium]